MTSAVQCWAILIRLGCYHPVKGPVDHYVWIDRCFARGTGRGDRESEAARAGRVTAGPDVCSTATSLSATCWTVRGGWPPVIGFGTSGVGDPGCDLVLAGTLLTWPARRRFRGTVCLEDETWARARGWALWKALVSLNGEDASFHRRVIAEVMSDRPS